MPLDADLRAKLPRLDVNQPHVLAASMKFEDGFVSRRELVIGGGVGYTADALLTPVAVARIGLEAATESEQLFCERRIAVRVSAVEKGKLS